VIENAHLRSIFGAPACAFAGPDCDSAGASKQRVFRVTTLEDGDYDSIPLQRLKNVVGTDGWAGRMGLWLLVVLVLVSIVSTTCYLHAKTRYTRACKLSVQVASLDTSANDVVHWLKLEKTAPQVRSKYPTMSNPSARLHTTATTNPRHPLKTPSSSSRARDSIALNAPELLRLPVGLATTLDIQQLMQSKQFDDDITPGHDSTFHRLKVVPIVIVRRGACASWICQCCCVRASHYICVKCIFACVMRMRMHMRIFMCVRTWVQRRICMHISACRLCAVCVHGSSTCVYVRVSVSDTHGVTAIAGGTTSRPLSEQFKQESAHRPPPVRECVLQCVAVCVAVCGNMWQYMAVCGGM